MFYATQDSEGDCIEKNATIKSFDTEQAALEYLKTAYPAEYWDLSDVKAVPGYFDDCWTKLYHRPTEDELDEWMGPFNHQSVMVRSPGQHPGGRQWWVSPAADVLVLMGVKERLYDED